MLIPSFSSVISVFKNHSCLFGCDGSLARRKPLRWIHGPMAKRVMPKTAAFGNKQEQQAARKTIRLPSVFREEKSCLPSVFREEKSWRAPGGPRKGRPGLGDGPCLQVEGLGCFEAKGLEGAHIRCVSQPIVSAWRCPFGSLRHRLRAKRSLRADSHWHGHAN